VAETIDLPRRPERGHGLGETSITEEERNKGIESMRIEGGRRDEADNFYSGSAVYAKKKKSLDAVGYKKKGVKHLYCRDRGIRNLWKG